MTLFRSGQQNRTLWVWAIETTHLWSAAEEYFRARSDRSRIPGEPDCSVVINNALAIERRGGRDGGGAPMLVRPVGRHQRPWNNGLLIGQKKPRTEERLVHSRSPKNTTIGGRPCQLY